MTTFFSLHWRLRVQVDAQQVDAPRDFHSRVRLDPSFWTRPYGPPPPCISGHSSISRRRCCPYVTILLDPKIKTQLDSADATTEILSLLAPVKELSSVAENATNAGLDAVCFEKLVVGMERHGVVANEDVPMEGYQMM